MPEGSRVLKMVPMRGRADGTEPIGLPCTRPLCDQEVIQPTGRSRPRKFCSDTCRRLYHRDRRKAQVGLYEAQRIAELYGLAITPLAADRSKLTTGTRPSSAQMALALIAQELETIRVDLEDGVLLTALDVYDRLVDAKTQGDRLLRAGTQHPPQKHLASCPQCGRRSS